MKILQLKLLLISLLFYCSATFSQQKIEEYFYETNDVHLNANFKIKPNNKFEYTIARGRGMDKSYSFGRISRQGNKYFLKSKVNNFDVKLQCKHSESIEAGRILITPLFYKDSTLEYGAYLLVDGDTLNKMYIHGLDGVLINSNFKTLKIQIREKYFTREIKKSEVIENVVNMQIQAPFLIDDFLYITNNYYFTRSYKKVNMFNENGEFLFSMIKKKIPLK